PEVSHAFLFTGPKGLGKTSTARIVAKVLNCEATTNEKQLTTDKKSKVSSQKSLVRSRGIEPCNKCDQCVSITNGTNLDILEIDGASNRGIDEIRDLREKIKLSPMASRKKIYIIDEVHMLTTEAFNALLKTLEEPPSHVVFILCTTEPHKVPATILSRCLHVQFKKATEEELVRSFERIIKREKLEAESEALRLIANLSDGSFRDGVKILEEMVLISKDKKITKELVQKHYSIASIQYKIAQIIKSFEEKDVKSGLGVVTKLVSEGVEMGHFMQGLIETLHNGLLFKAGVEFSAENSGLMIDNTKLEIFEIKKLIELLSEAKSELKYAVLPQIPLELVIVEWSLQEKINTDLDTDKRRSVQRESASKSALIKEQTTVIEKDVVADKPSVVVTQQDISKYSENDALWNALIDKVKTHNHSIAGVLRGCKIKSYDNKVLLLETNFKFHKDKLSEIKAREILDNSLREVTKKNVKIEVELKAR
ncbi:MAG: DNA polymerase III subunit gamma/tau, partial [Candidatus Levybacteria bacterium]|nr:DNA polymerase III subunit gamma/tau [Candidatus Levybacteria bacterium]